MYGREREPELTYTDVWENSFMNIINPEYFYHFFFCGIIFSLETEVNQNNFSGQSIIHMKKDHYLLALEGSMLCVDIQQVKKDVSHVNFAKVLVQLELLL